MRITQAAALRTRRDAVVDFTLTHPVDGFSHHQPLLVYFAGGVSTEGVVFHTDDPQQSLRPTSKVVVLDGETGKPVPAWAEVDLNTTEPSEQPSSSAPSSACRAGTATSSPCRTC